MSAQGLRGTRWEGYDDMGVEGQGLTATNTVKFEVGLKRFWSLTARREKGRDCW